MNIQNDSDSSPAKTPPCSGVARTFLDDYTEKLIETIENAENGLQVSDIRAFLKAYKANHTDALNPFIRSQYQHCRTRCEQDVLDPATRRESFKRVISARIADLFPTSPEADETSRIISRRMLPGLFSALGKMVGNDFFTKGDRTCAELAADLKRQNQFFLWEDLYTSDLAQDIVDDLLMALVTHFADPMKRISWMVGVINTDLASPDEYYFEGSSFQEWTLDEAGMVHILRHLFGHLKHQLTDPQRAKKIGAKYGAADVRALLALINTLDHVEV